MYSSQFSEFSYGYALTDNILHSGLPATPAAPIFPSLLQEGKSGGYDVKIPMYPVPIFLQFKVPQVVWRRSDRMPQGFQRPYLRMHLRTKRPNQHRLLLNWESGGRLVYYATPDFWQTEDLDRYFSQRRVHQRSWYIRPRQIGQLDSDPHHLAYEEGNNQFWRCSEPVKMEGRFGGEALGHDINEAVEHATKQEPLTFLHHLSDEIAKSVGVRAPRLQMELEDSLPIAQLPKTSKSKPRVQDSKRESEHNHARKERKREKQLIARAAQEAGYMSQVHLGCTLIITGKD